MDNSGVAVRTGQAVDFVVTWVDGSDPEWLAEKAKWDHSEPTFGTERSSARYRDWDNLRYWFRGIEKYAPWVRKVYFVTAGHLPPWLNADCEKLEIVRHDAFIPQQYLPTFSSHPIELNLFRIHGLSEQFVYFNDDMYLMSPVSPDDFFYRGLPRDEALLTIHCPKESRIIHTIAANNTGVINEHFDMGKALRQHAGKWFSPGYGLKNLMVNLVLAQCPRFPGFRQYHGPTPMLKSVCEEVWSRDRSLDMTSTHRFRDCRDVNQWVFREWALASGRFVPAPRHRQARMIAFDQMDFDEAIAGLRAAFTDRRLMMLCINDFDHEGDAFKLERAVQEVNRLFEERFPTPSQFER